MDEYEGFYTDGRDSPVESWKGNGFDSFTLFCSLNAQGWGYGDGDSDGYGHGAGGSQFVTNYREDI